MNLEINATGWQDVSLPNDTECTLAAYSTPACFLPFDLRQQHISDRNNSWGFPLPSRDDVTLEGGPYTSPHELEIQQLLDTGHIGFQRLVLPATALPQAPSVVDWSNFHGHDIAFDRDTAIYFSMEPSSQVEAGADLDTFNSPVSLDGFAPIHDIKRSGHWNPPLPHRQDPWTQLLSLWEPPIQQNDTPPHLAQFTPSSTTPTGSHNLVANEIPGSFKLCDTWPFDVGGDHLNALYRTMEFFPPVSLEGGYTCLNDNYHSQIDVGPSHATSQPLKRTRSVMSHEGKARPRRRRSASRSSAIASSGSSGTTQAENSPRKTGRQGPLSPETNANAQQNRTEYLTCYNCKAKKVTCLRPSGDFSGDLQPCSRCVKDEEPCRRHFFFKNICRSELYHKGQYLLNCLTVPPWFKPFMFMDIDFMSNLCSMEVFMRDCNIRVRCMDEAGEFTLRLSSCHALWQHDIFKQSDTCSMEQFVTGLSTYHDIKYSDYLDMPQCDWAKPIEAFLQLDAMSSDVKCYLTWDSECCQLEEPVEAMGVLENWQQRLCFISMATFQHLRQRLEMLACSQLERDLTSRTTAQGNNSTIKPNIEVLNLSGRYLLSLRRRISVWKKELSSAFLAGAGPFMDRGVLWHAIAQMESICYDIYCRFCFHSQSMDLSLRNQVEMERITAHPDTGLRREYLPSVKGEEGFAAWMRDGES